MVSPVAAKNTGLRDAAMTSLKASLTNKRASLSPTEAAFLKALLLDTSMDESNHVDHMTKATAKLNEDVLFSLPFLEQSSDGPTTTTTIQPKPHHHFQIGLWSAFADGISPKAMIREATNGKKKQEGEKYDDAITTQEDVPPDDQDSVKSDQEVRREHDDQSNSSSIDEKDAAPEHYDSWEVLKDEYAKDFGFDFKPSLDDDLDDGNHVFSILGTSVHDKASYPHVLSPPLMDSLMTFLPEAVQNQNYWLKYSLVRDGASLHTLLRYVRGAGRTVLAIETADGQVFGSFTSSHWISAQAGFYGSGESLLWRMRHNRHTVKCSSLFEQAQLESEIDVYFYSGQNEMIQLCREDRIAIGGGELLQVENEDDAGKNLFERSQQFEFGLTLETSMTSGASGPCATFRNPCLVDGGSKSRQFDIVNVEVWTLTPCVTVDAAEKLELMQFFIHHESTRSLSSTRHKASDFKQQDFYRRVGEGDDNEQQREIWQYTNMMNADR